MPERDTPYTASRRIDSLQILRAVAVILVTVLHSQAQASAFYDRAGIPHDPASVRLGNLGMFGVDLFFVISGFILSLVAMRPAADKPSHNAVNFLLRRIVRIYPVYWLLMLFPALRLLHRHQLGLSPLLTSLFLLPGLHVPIATPLVPVGWTLIFELFFYSLLAAWLLHGTRHAARNTILTLVALVLAGTVSGIRQPVLVVILNPMLLEFAGGGLLAFLYNRWCRPQSSRSASAERRWRIGAWCALSAGLLSLASTAWAANANSAIQRSTLEGQDIWPRLIPWGTSAVLIVGGFVLLFESRRPGGPLRSMIAALIACGDASYSIYLTAVLSAELWIRVQQRFPKPAYAARPLILLVTLCVSLGTILVGMVFYRLIEAPVTRKLQRLVGRLPARSLAQLVS